MIDVVVNIIPFCPRVPTTHPNVCSGECKYDAQDGGINDVIVGWVVTMEPPQHAVDTVHSYNQEEKAAQDEEDAEGYGQLEIRAGVGAALQEQRPNKSENICAGNGQH